MQPIINWAISSGSIYYILIFLVFLSSMALFYFGYLFLWPSVEVAGRASAVAEGDAKSALRVSMPQIAQGQDAELQEAIEAFYLSLQTDDLNALSRRMIRAGFFKKSAIYYFYIIRIAAAVIAFLGTYIVVTAAFKDIQVPVAAAAAAVAALLALVIPSFVVDKMGNRQEELYRRSFPDFMDMLVVCADAGLSLEAAVARVAREMLITNRKFGIHLNIMMLEVRAGKRLRDALTSFSDRLALDEAQALATVFKQSEELGSSLTHTLRVFSQEMRRARIVRAEEKANALPVKMIFPLGLFMFPVMITVIALPVLLTLSKLLGATAPHG